MLRSTNSADLTSTLFDQSANDLNHIHQEAERLCYEDPKKAIKLSKHSLKRARVLADPKSTARALALIAHCYLNQDKHYSQASQHLKEALQLTDAEAIPFRANLFLDLGRAYTAMSKPDKALEYLERASELRLGEFDLLFEARYLRILALVHIEKGKYTLALSQLLKALDIYEKHKAGALYQDSLREQHDEAALYRSIAIVHSVLGQYLKAVEYYQTAFGLYQKINPSLAARTLYNIGIAYDMLEQYPEAMHFYQHSAELYKQNDNKVGLAVSQIGIGAIFTVQDNYEEAYLNILSAVNALKGRAGFERFYGDALANLAELQKKMGSFEAAIETNNEVYSLYKKDKRPSVHFAELHRSYYEAYKAQENYAKALEHHEKLLSLTEEHLEQNRTEQMNELMVTLETQVALKDKEIYQLRNVELEHEIQIRKEAEQLLADAKIELEQQNKQLEALSHRDPLTQLYNRRYLNDVLEFHIFQAERYERPLSLMICDIDNFKQINDTYSHALGDDVLKLIAQIMEDSFRKTDICARWGGEEFVVVFPETALEDAVVACEFLRHSVESYAWERLHEDLKVTMSLGASCYEKGLLAELLINEADIKLYEAKRSGKNKLCY